MTETGRLPLGIHRGEAFTRRREPYAAFEEFYVVESPAMLRLALGLVDSPARAEEIVQDAFERVLLAWDRLERPGGFLRTCVVNGSRSELRRRRILRRPAMRVSATSVEAPDTADTALLAALGRLTPQRRLALVLRFYADLSEADIAEAMSVRPGTVKSLLSRGLADLRKVVQP